MRFGFFGSDCALIHHGLDVAVVAGDLSDCIPAQEIEAGISDVTVEEAIVADDRCGASRAHADELGMLLGKILNSGVSGLIGFDQRVYGLVIGSIQKDFPNGIDGEPAGYLAALMSSHAVSDCDEPATLLESFSAFGLGVAEVVFILGTLAADITEIGELNSGPRVHRRGFIETRLGETLEFDAQFAEPDDIVVFQLFAGDFFVVNVGAIRRIQVGEEEFAFFTAEAGMLAGYGVVAQDDI